MLSELLVQVPLSLILDYTSLITQAEFPSLFKPIWVGFYNTYKQNDSDKYNDIKPAAARKYIAAM